MLWDQVTSHGMPLGIPDLTSVRSERANDVIDVRLSALACVHCVPTVGGRAIALPNKPDIERGCNYLREQVLRLASLAVTFGVPNYACPNFGESQYFGATAVP